MNNTLIRVKNKKVLRLCVDALLTTIALIIFVIELALPSITPIPGIKLGLSNIVTLVTMFMLGPLDAFLVMFVRVLLGCLLTGQVMALAYSFAGGILSFLVIFLFKKVTNEKQIFICSVFGAVAHNMGQIMVAIILTHTTAIMYYFPVLCVSGIISGLFTGLAAQYTITHLKKLSI